MGYFPGSRTFMSRLIDYFLRLRPVYRSRAGHPITDPAVFLFLIIFPYSDSSVPCVT